jgi:predicted PurR-regulated permease PerM
MNRLKTSGMLLRHLQIIFFLTAILYFGRGLLVPLLYGLLIAIVLTPLCRRLEHYRWPRSLAVGFCLMIVSIVLLSLLGLIVYQFNILKGELPAIMNKAEPAIKDLHEWFQGIFGINPSKQKQWLGDAVNSLGNSIPGIVQTIIVTVSGSIVTALLIPIYAALFLYERETFVKFITIIAGVTLRASMPRILSDVVATYSNFIKGTAIVYVIVGLLNALGLAILGVPHPLLFGMLTAIMTIVPYIGIILSAMLPVAAVWLTKDSIWYPLGVVIVFSVVQYLEANVIFPRVVGIRLRVSTWAMLVAIVSGGLMWGVSGMILFIPLTGILKIILSHVAEWKNLNILLDRS